MSTLLQNEATLRDVAGWVGSSYTSLKPWSQFFYSIGISSDVNIKGPYPISAAAGEHNPTVLLKTEVP